MTPNPPTPNTPRPARRILVALAALLALTLAACGGPDATSTAVVPVVPTNTAIVALPTTAVQGGPTATPRSVPTQSNLSAPTATSPPAPPAQRTGVPALPPAQSTVEVPQPVQTGEVPQPVQTGQPPKGTPPSGTPQGTTNEPPRISLAQAHALWEQGSILLVDVRSTISYQARHIKGAVSYPFDKIDDYAASLPHDKLIIAYCQ